MFARIKYIKSTPSVHISIIAIFSVDFFFVAKIQMRLLNVVATSMLIDIQWVVKLGRRASVN